MRAKRHAENLRRALSGAKVVDVAEDVPLPSTGQGKVVDVMSADVALRFDNGWRLFLVDASAIVLGVIVTAPAPETKVVEDAARCPACLLPTDEDEGMRRGGTCACSREVVGLHVEAKRLRERTALLERLVDLIRVDLCARYRIEEEREGGPDFHEVRRLLRELGLAAPRVARCSLCDRPTGEGEGRCDCSWEAVSFHRLSKRLERAERERDEAAERATSTRR